MNNKEKQKILAEELSTKEGRRKIAESLVAPIKYHWRGYTIDELKELADQKTKEKHKLHKEIL